jgi:uncharacterized protein YecE (DUF72 family)
VTGTVRIGISGWTYAGWRGRFYPKGLGAKHELAYAARRFHTIEVNGTHYRLQRPESFAQWRDETPDDFVFALKGSRYITHMLQLRDAKPALANFFASGPLRLGPKLGPILWQFPPRTKFDAARLGAFLDLLPRDTEEAAALAKKHDDRTAGHAWLKSEAHRRLRHAVESRHDSFRDPAFIELLRRHNIALVVADTVEWPLLMDVTADFVYCRLHGSKQLYASGYGPKALAHWATLVKAWAAGRDPSDAPHVKPPRKPRRGYDVYVYFDNDAKVRAPVDAAALMKRAGLAPT